MKRLTYPLYLLLGTLCALLLGTHKTTLAQTASPEINAVHAHLRGLQTVDFPKIMLDVAVWDVNGLTNRSLQAADFTIWEDGKNLGAPTHLTRSDAPPLDVVLALDISGSMAAAGALPAAQQAAFRFLDRLRPIDRATVLAFNDQLDTSLVDSVGLTNDKTALYDFIESLVPNGETRLYEAASLAVQTLPTGEPSHQAVILFTDGRNETSIPADPQQALRLAQTRQIPIFVVGLGSDIDGDYLESLASQSGGAYLPRPTASELAQAFQQIADLLQQQYQLTYQSTGAADGQQHQTAVGIGAAAPGGAWNWRAPQLLVITTTPMPTPTVPALTPTVSAPIVVVAPTAPNYHLWQWALGGGALLLIGIVAWLWLRRRVPTPLTKPPTFQKMVCARCGYDRTGTPPGKCPQCGETKRLPHRT
jgi:VWFA-related protein